mmetsp:Transcript_64324/g.140031  ORF Transcript_64324/g.140031 Transcript_64324/m.140031 type:complete len:100 (-) Transcript_64324:487-786(-)
MRELMFNRTMRCAQQHANNEIDALEGTGMVPTVLVCGDNPDQVSHFLNQLSSRLGPRAKVVTFKPPKCHPLSGPALAVADMWLLSRTQVYESSEHSSPS